MVLSFLVLGYYGGEIYRKAPPIPKRVITMDGQVLFTAQDIKEDQNFRQSMGGQQVGSIWGPGAYVAPDWSGDWLHREAVWLLQTWACVEHRMWYARSAEFLQQPLLQNLHWLRMVGDTIFVLGVVGIGWFVFGLKTGWSFADQSEASVALAAAAREAELKP